MGPKTKWTAVLAGVLLIAMTASAGANLIAWNTGRPLYSRVVIMDDAGGDPVQVYEGVSVDSISAEDPNGDSWILFIEWDGLNNSLYKMRADGGADPEKVLCGACTAAGLPYSGIDHPQWSPDGSQILVHLLVHLLGDLADSIALLPGDFTTAEDCVAPDLTPLPTLPEGGWGINGHATWSGDGSMIAHFDPDGTRLVIRDRNTGWTPRDVTLVPPVAGASIDVPAFYPDWQRHGNLIAFEVREGDGRKSTDYVLWVDAENGDWDYLRDQNGDRVPGHRYGRTSPTWSPDDQYLLFTESGGDLVKWDYDLGAGTAIGSGVWADWQRDALDLTCSVDADCDDGKPCTDDLCDTGTGECGHFNKPDETSCGINGWCQVGSCFEPECDVAGLPDCDDFNECTFDQCNDWECAFTPAPSDYGCSDGDDCTSNDRCDGAGGCSGDPIPGCGACLPKGATCTTNAECCSQQCHPVKGTCK